MSQSNNVSFF